MDVFKISVPNGITVGTFDNTTSYILKYFLKILTPVSIYHSYAFYYYFVDLVFVLMNETVRLTHRSAI